MTTMTNTTSLRMKVEVPADAAVKLINSRGNVFSHVTAGADGSTLVLLPGWSVTPA